MGDTVRIPRTLNAAEKRLTEIGGLVTAREWERAAIVAAFVQVGRRGRGQIPESGFEWASTFAERGIHGLTSDTTVAIYAHRWLDHFPRPTPGSSVELPYWCGKCKFDAPDEGCTPWPPSSNPDWGHGTETAAVNRARTAATKHPKAAAVAATATPAARQAAKKAIQEEENKEREERATKAGISQAQRKQRAQQKAEQKKQDLLDEAERLRNSPAIQEWDDAPATYRGVALLNLKLDGVMFSIKELQDFLQLPVSELNAEWRDTETVVMALDDIAAWRMQLDDIEALLQAALNSASDLTVEDIVGRQ